MAMALCNSVQGSTSGLRSARSKNTFCCSSTIPRAQPLVAASALRIPAPFRNAPHLSRGASNSRVRTLQRGQRAVAVRAEISYVMIKPDGVQRGLVGDIISRFERKGFKLVGLKLFSSPKQVVEEHYKDLKEKPFYPALMEYILSGPVVCMVWEGKGVVASARKLIGATNPLNAEPGTIRGDLAVESGRNVVHGSDSVENGERETALWFPEGIVSYSRTMEAWLRE